ncbi:hypothetical protein BX666DRAFT_2020956 [Dichotomocladium elegans]|nr:hypothetical protein BX666DRAFT_2020956 [Dichotomocladium elegans]
MANLDIKIKLSNSLATLLLVGVHSFSYFKMFLAYVIGLHENHFILFSIGILHLLLIGTTIYQWLPIAPKDAFEAIGYWYLLVAILNSAASIFKVFSLDLFAFVALLWQLAVLVFLYHRLRDYPPRNHADVVFVNGPFSFYTAAATFAALWQAIQFNSLANDHPVVITLVILATGFVALHLVDYSHRRDWVYALTTGWILLVAAVFLTGTPHVVSLVVVGILVSAVARALIPNWLVRINRRFSHYANRASERAPLLGGR